MSTRVPNLLCQLLCCSLILSSLLFSVFYFCYSSLLPFHFDCSLVLCLLLPDQNFPLEIQFYGLSLAPAPWEVLYSHLDLLVLSVALQFSLQLVLMILLPANLATFNFCFRCTSSSSSSFYCCF